MAFQMSNTTTYGLEQVLRQNILNSDYYNNTCLELTTWDEVVDEIYENVAHVEPWMSGGARGPSTAFCLLHRLFTLNIQVRDVRALIDHKDSPYIRAVGFLYLRYVADPKVLWKWVENYANDKEEFAPSPGEKKIPMGEFVRDLLLEQYYFETIFPRIPKPVMDNMIEELKARKLPTTPKGNGGQGGADRRGVEDGNKRPASVKASLSVAMGQRAPNRAGAREERHSTANGVKTSAPAPRSPPPGDGGRARSRERSPAPARGGSYADRDRERDSRRDERDGRRDERDSRRDYDRDSRREYDRDSRRDDRYSSRRDDEYDRRDRERDSRRDDRGTRDERDTRRDYRDYKDSRDNGSRRSRSRSRDRGRYEREERHNERDRGSRRSRSRSRDRRDTEGGGRDARDVFKESARTVAGDRDLTDIRSRY